jgi:transposase
MKAAAAPAAIDPEHHRRLCAENAQLREQLQSLQRQLDWFKRQLFGQKSEKRHLIDLAVQPSLPGWAAREGTSPLPTEQVTYTRRRPKQRDAGCVTDEGLRFDAAVPVEVIRLAPPELSGADADQYEVIDEKVTRRLAQRPGSYVVLEYRRPVLKHKGTQALSVAAAPPAVFEQSVADVSLLAGLLVDKFVYHLPLYRQHQRLADAGIQLSRSTLTAWVQRSIELLRPVEEAQRRHLLQSKVLAMDETPIKAGRAGQGKLRTGWYWPIYGEADEVCFTYSASRGSQHVKDQLAGFAGVLLSDGYAAYEQFARHRPEVTHAQCWAHCRRHFEQAEASYPQAVAEALAQIGAMYRVEATIRKDRLDREAALACRLQHARPVVDGFFGWCREQRQRLDLVNSDPLARALVYASEREAALRVYLGDPDVPIDTNHLERALRVIPMGKKAWLFNWTEIGARHVGIIQGLLVTCRLHNIDPYTFLVDVLQRVNRHPAREVEQLTPRCWKDRFAKSPLRSDLARDAD